MHRVMEGIEHDYPIYEPTLRRLKKLQDAHDNQVDDYHFPTRSKMGIPSLFGYVQQSLPGALDTVWPDSHKIYTCIPFDQDADMETVERVEDGLNHFVRHRLKAKRSTLPTIVNAFKCNLGYGAITTRITSTPAVLNKRFLVNGRSAGMQRQVGVGAPRKTVIYEDLSLGEIIVSDDGSDFNGHDAVSRVYRIKLYSEAAFRRLYARVKADCEDVDVKGNVERIIAQAASFGFNLKVPVYQIIKELGGIDVMRQNQSSNEGVPPIIPVVQFYGEQEHIWVANGTEVIFEDRNTLQTLRRPLVKASVTVDSKQWHPMNPAEAGQAIANGRNLYANLMMDLVISAAKPYMVYDRDRFDGKPPVVGLNGDIAVTGNAATALDFPTTPQVNQSHLSYDDLLGRMYQDAVGQQAQPTAGLLRGGLHAFEQAMGSLGGRQRLANMVLEMGLVENIGAQALIEMQLMADNNGMTYQDREYDWESGKDKAVKRTVTYEDLAHVYEVALDTTMKNQTVGDVNERIQISTALANDQTLSRMADPLARAEYLIGNPNLARRMFPSRQKSREIAEAEAQRQQQLEAQQAGMQEAAGGPPGGTAEAAEMGAMSTEGGPQ